jgi:hypothetical protein
MNPIKNKDHLAIVSSLTLFLNKEPFDYTENCITWANIQINPKTRTLTYRQSQRQAEQSDWLIKVYGIAAINNYTVKS